MHKELTFCVLFCFQISYISFFLLSRQYHSTILNIHFEIDKIFRDLNVKIDWLIENWHGSKGYSHLAPTKKKTTQIKSNQINNNKIEMIPEQIEFCLPRRNANIDISLGACKLLIVIYWKKKVTTAIWTTSDRKSETKEKRKLTSTKCMNILLKGSIFRTIKLYYYKS